MEEGRRQRERKGEERAEGEVEPIQMFPPLISYRLRPLEMLIW